MALRRSPRLNKISGPSLGGVLTRLRASKRLRGKENGRIAVQTAVQTAKKRKLGTKIVPTVTKARSRPFEEFLWSKGLRNVAGVDEAGRGPLAGPVVAAACVIPENVFFDGALDSKKLSEKAREALFEEITSHPDVSWAIEEVDEKTIEMINILEGSLLAMQRAVEKLSLKVDAVLVDGIYLPRSLPIGLQHSEAIKGGDDKVHAISCASILAKVHRDRLLVEADKIYPGYGFAKHKGYPSRAHLEILKKIGPCEIHRKTFAPVRLAASQKSS